MAENKITFDVLAAWNDLARAILRDGELSAKLITGGTIQRRDLELLESALTSIHDAISDIKEINFKIESNTR